MNAAIVIRAAGAAGPLRTCLSSLAQFVPPECTVYVLDGAPDSGIGEVCQELSSSFPHLEHVPKEASRGLQHFRGKDRDLLLLDVNARVAAGFLEELQAVLYLHERHGAVSPRGNNAGLFSLPLPEENLDADASYSAWQAVKDLLPRYQVMPAAAGFCVLIKAEILQRFGDADEAGDETEFLCHINRYGYSTVAANWAYVFQQQAPPLPYPEQDRAVVDYQQIHRNPLEKFAPLFLPHRRRILFDLFHLTSAHSGTSEVGLNLLRELSRMAEDEFEITVGVNPSTSLFANELAGYRFYTGRPEERTTFDLVFKPCQLTSWTELRLMHQVAPRLSYTMLDVIGVRCDYLNSPKRQILLRKAAGLVDRVFTISDFSRSDFAAFFGLDTPMQVIHLGTSAGMTEGEFRPGAYVLVVGNDFVHKGVREAVRQFRDSTLPVVVLGGGEEFAQTNIRFLPSGNLSRQHVRELFSNARVVVYPSYYEGFGLPVVDALALGKPVVVLDSAMNRELAAMASRARLYRIQSMEELPALTAKLFDLPPEPPAEEPRRWSDVAAEYLTAFRDMLSRDIDLVKLHARWEALQTLDSADHL